MCRRVSFLAVLLVLAGLGSRQPLPAVAQGQVYTDTMDSAATGLLSVESSEPTITYTYQNGQYLVQASEPAFAGELNSYLDVPVMASSRLTVDVALGGNPSGKYVMAGCRASGDNDGYALVVFPGTGGIYLYREDPDESVILASTTDPNLVHLGNATNQIGIDCSINIITGIVNGEPVLSTFDPAYASGTSYIGAGAGGDETDGLTVGFDNLSITDNGNLALVDAPTVTPTVVLGPAPVAPTPQTAPMRDPNTDPGGTLSDAFAISLELPPVVSSIGGDDAVSLDSVSTWKAGVQLADFYAELHFPAPNMTGMPVSTRYLVGFCFWVDPAGNCYDIYVEDAGVGMTSWGYGYDPADGEYQSIATGTLPSGTVDPTPGAVNFLSLTVYQGVAILSGNTYDVSAVIPLEGTPIAGDIKAEVGFTGTVSGVTAPPLPMSFDDFAVWDLSSGMAPVPVEPQAADTEQPAVSATVAALPTAAPTVAALPSVASTGGPTLPPVQSSGALSLAFQNQRAAALAYPPLASGRSGVLSQMANLSVSETSDVSVSDSYTVATFTNPSDLSTPFDIGIGVRASTGIESGYRLVVRSDATWYLMPAGQALIDSGNADGFNTQPGAVNTIEVLVQGGTGVVVINGVVLRQLDLSGISTPGDVYIGTGFLDGDTVPGRQVEYTNWWVYPTNILDVKSG